MTLILIAKKHVSQMHPARALLAMAVPEWASALKDVLVRLRIYSIRQRFYDRFSCLDHSTFLLNYFFSLENISKIYGVHCTRPLHACVI